MLDTALLLISRVMPIAGATDSHDFPIRNALQNMNKGPRFSAFVTKLNKGGSDLIYSTYLGIRRK